MGGRGGASGFPGGGAGGPQVAPQATAQTEPRSVAETKDLSELEQYMSKIGVTVDSKSLAGQTFENVRAAADGIERVMKEFPQAAFMFSTLRGADLRNGVIANASFSGTITLGSHYFSQDEDAFSRVYDRSVASGFHPAGTGKNDVAVHEAGHVLETALIHRAFPDMQSNYWDRVEAAEAWRKCKLSSKIVSEACKNAKKTPAGKGKKNAELIKDVSGYATANRSETLAECVADYAANGNNARALSVEVWKILKRELG